jgi:hypothetical protein
MWGKGIDINPDDDTSYTTIYQDALLNYVENEYSTIHNRFPVSKPEHVPNNNLVFSAVASSSDHSSYDPSDLSSNDEEYLMPRDVAETTPEGSDGAGCRLTAGRLYMNSPAE